MQRSDASRIGAHRAQLRGPSRSDLVHWHETDMPTALRDVRSQEQSGKHLLTASSSQFDPPPKSSGNRKTVVNVIDLLQCWCSRSRADILSSSTGGSFIDGGLISWL